MTEVGRVDYDAIAAQYDQRYRDRPYAGVERVVRAHLSGAVSALEIGCGTGHWLGVAAHVCELAVGLDPSRAMLRRAHRSEADTVLVEGVAERLPFADASLDRLTAVNAIHHFSDPTAFARDANRVLRPSGRLLVVGLDPALAEDSWYVYDYFPSTRARDQARYPATSVIREWLTGAGFDPVETTVADRLVENESAGPFLDRGGAAKEATSQLVLLSNDEYREGIARIRRDVERAAAEGRDHRLACDLTLHATHARRP